MKKYQSLSFVSGVIAVLGYIVFALIAYLQYPLPYSPLKNWLSDLGNTGFNPYGAIWYNIGIILTALMLVLFFLGLSRWRMENNRAQTIMLFLAQTSGILGAFCMMMSGIFPIYFFEIHSFWSTSLYILLSTGFVFLAAALRYHPVIPGWLLVLGISTAPMVILTAFLPHVYVLEWITVMLFLCYVSLVGMLLQRSSGKQIPFGDENGKLLAGSISEKIFVDINGVEQGMFIKSKDAAHPVLLYVHGGMPEYFLTRRYPTGLEDLFTVVWWEQPGSGISYREGIPRERLTLEQLIADTLAMTQYLHNRFHQEKIYLMGHCGGSFIAIQAAAQAPELYHAYVGVAQMSNQLRSERLAYEYMLQQFKDNGDRSMVRKLEAAPVTMTDGAPDAYLTLRDAAMHRLGIGTTHDIHSVITGIFLPSLTSREYTFIEKVRLWRAKSRSGVSCLWDRMLKTDLAKEVPELDLPVYFFHGIYDYTCSYPEAKAYFEQLRAPLKGFYTFEQSAHSPLFEEPENTQRILLEDVLVGANSLADLK